MNKFTIDIKASSITENPDVTSIISAFEANENPISLFFNEIVRSNNYIDEKLDLINGTLETIKEWLTTVYPCFQVDKPDYNQCVIKFKEIEKKVIDLHKMYQRSTSDYDKNIVIDQFARCRYRGACGRCDMKFNLNNVNDLNTLEQHEHVEKILALGTSLQTILVSEINNDELNSNFVEEDANVIDESINNSKHNNYSKLSVITYTADIQNVLYPKNLMQKICKIENNFAYFTIKSISHSPPRFFCLLCRSDLASKKCIDSHIFGQKHCNRLQNPEFFSRLVEYHQSFQLLPNNFQVFQVIFKPAPHNLPENKVVCLICYKTINILYIPKHVVEDRNHQQKFQLRKATKYHFHSEMQQIINNLTDENGTFSTENFALSRKENELILEADDENHSTSSSKSQSIIFDENTVEASSSNITPTSSNTQTKTNNTDNKQKKNVSIVLNHTIIPSYKGNPVEMKDYIANRFHKHLNFISTDCEIDTCICTFCKKSIVNNYQALVSHFVTDEHKLKSRAEFDKVLYNFYCSLCYKYVKTDLKWNAHLLSMSHRQREDSYYKTIKKDCNFEEYECIDCKLVLYANKINLEGHVNGKYGIPNRRKKVKEIKLSIELEKMLKNEMLFTGEIYKLSKESIDVLNSIELALKCCRSIEKTLAPVFGAQVHAYPFGSRVSGLGNTASDLDVFVDIGEMYEGLNNQTSDAQTYIVQQTARALRRHTDFDDVCSIPQARTPIVQVYHKLTDLDCDLSFRHGLSIENTEFLRLCIAVQPKLKTLILFLKKWIVLNKLKDKISTYAISMMAIFFMQNKKYLPSLQRLRKIDPRDSKIIAGWETFCFRKPLSELIDLFPNYPRFTRNLLKEFYNFYIKFDFQTQVICPLLGKSVPKIDFSEAKGIRLPIEMASYVKKINENKDSEIFKITKSICIQDPFDLSHNLTKACPEDVLTKMLILSKQSYQLLLH